MARFDKYLLSQLMMLFGFFSLVLVLVYWVNRAVLLFDTLIASGQSAGTFLEITALTLPNVIRIVLPISAFVAAIFVANRLSSESELVVVQATGYSPYRLVRPVLYFGLIVGLLLSVLTHILVPTSVFELKERQARISQNITARLLTEGTFVHPVDGITFYVREISPEGELLDVFLSDSRNGVTRTNYSARRALLLSEPTGPKLVMINGMAQTLELADQRLSVTSFNDFAYDIGVLLPGSLIQNRGIAAMSTLDLLWPSEAILKETGASKRRLIETGHERISQALLAVVAAMLGFSTLLLGGFSRFGLWRQIILAIVLLLGLKSFDNSMIDVALKNDGAWPAVYAATLLGIGLLLVILWAAARPALFRRRFGLPRFPDPQSAPPGPNAPSLEPAKTAAPNTPGKASST
ncbi:MAG: LptF/LptG family permease [Paracoccaceae bacterium]